MGRIAHKDDARTPLEFIVPNASEMNSLEREFAHFSRTQQRRVRLFISRKIRNHADAEDLAQQTFFEAFRSLRNFRHQSELSTWILGIAVNVVRNHLSRDKNRKYTFVDIDTLFDHEGNEMAPNLRARFHVGLDRLRDELVALPDELRGIIQLVAFEDLSYQEAADMLGIPVGTVRSRLFRARAMLRERMPQMLALIDEM
ncbi:MAG: sigma-70 family RNA polymerase sigma factor [Parvibaculaceae bacterium]|nr:sigma-70 family RNA polymerase sigma factor [Parvibaculaceae bacterium]